MWGPPDWVCPAPGSPACARVPNIPLGHCLCPPSTGTWFLLPHCPSFPLVCVPPLFLPHPGTSILLCPHCSPCSPQSLPWMCPLYPARFPFPTLRMSPLFPLPPQIPPQDLPLLPPWCVSGYVPNRPPGCPLCCPHSSLSEMSLPSSPSPISPWNVPSLLCTVPDLPSGMSPLTPPPAQSLPGCPPHAPCCPQ